MAGSVELRRGIGDVYGESTLYDIPKELIKIFLIMRLFSVNLKNLIVKLFSMNFINDNVLSQYQKVVCDYF